MHLIWLVTLPGKVPINISFDGSSSLEAVYYLDMNISATLTNYIAEEYIESIIVLTVLRDVVVNGTVIECRSGDLDRSTAIVNVNMSGKYSLSDLFLLYVQLATSLFSARSSKPSHCILCYWTE